MLGAMADSPGLARLPPSFRARAEEVAAAARDLAAGAKHDDRARAVLRSTSDLLMDSADVVLATTNSAAIEHLVAERAAFDAVIVEEAAKATGPELVGPLLLSGRRLLIGDHNQLPPFDAAMLEGVLGSHALTSLVLRDAERLIGGLIPAGELDDIREVAASEPRMEQIRGLSHRLVQFFKTIAIGDEARAGGPRPRPLTSVLDEQRRMHPAIAEVVSRAFYAGRLRTAKEREAEAYADPPPFACSGPLPGSPLVVADFPHVMRTGRERAMEGEGRRWTNPDEADAVLADAVPADALTQPVVDHHEQLTHEEPREDQPVRHADGPEVAAGSVPDREPERLDDEVDRGTQRKRSTEQQRVAPQGLAAQLPLLVVAPYRGSRWAEAGAAERAAEGKERPGRQRVHPLLPQRLRRLPPRRCCCPLPPRAPA